MDVRAPIPLAAALALPVTLEDELPMRDARRRYLLDPEGAPPSQVEPPGRRPSAMIGPASGFSPQERERIKDQGYVSILLSDSRLRTETAAMAWAAWWSASPDSGASSRSGPEA
jgi:RsmE family RNA methyltransferase